MYLDNFIQKSTIKKSMNKIKNNDIIGCGINFLKGELFFTHNGVYCGNK